MSGEQDCSFEGGILVYILGFLLQWKVILAILVIYLVKKYIIGVRIAKRPHQPQVVYEEEPIVGHDKPITATDPASGAVLNTENAFSADDVREAIRRAHVAQEYWAQVSFEERRAVLRDIITYVVEHQNEICLASVRDTGKTPLEAVYGEILTTCEKLRWIINEGADALATEYRTPPALLFLKRARVEYHPIGVIGVIIPWNYPFHNVASAVASAIFAGNAAVVKVSEYANGSRAYFEKIFQDILRSRGHSPHLVQLIPGYGVPAGQTLVEECDKLLFIGSPATGRHIVTASRKNLTPVTLELGGKDPFIVFDDAEFDHAVDVALRGVFTNNGQNCIAAERIYVQASIYDRFADAVTAKARGLRQRAIDESVEKSEAPDCGCLTMEAQYDKVVEMVNRAVDAGAELLAGGEPHDELRQKGGLYFRPTVLGNVTADMEIVREEVFGPVMLLIKFKDEADVVKQANASQFALGSSVFTTDYARAERVTKALVAGMTTVNDFGVGYLIQSLPFGGFKESGWGRFNGVEGLREFSRIKSVVTDRFPIRTKAPSFVQYPIPSHAETVVKDAVRMLYAPTWLGKLRGTLHMLKALISKSANPNSIASLSKASR